jgi:hypothetical protein
MTETPAHGAPYPRHPDGTDRGTFSSARLALIRAWVRPGAMRMVAGGGTREPLAAVSTLHLGPFLAVTAALGGLLVTLIGLAARALLQRRPAPKGQTT